MEGGVETRDLGQLREAHQQPPDWRKVVGLMQGGERNQFLQCREDRLVDAHGRGIGDTAVHDTMAHADQSVARQLTAHETEQMVECAFVAERDAVAHDFSASTAPTAFLATNRGAV
jgi:hypothetical protein